MTTSIEQTALMRKASELAKQLHEGQTDKSGVSYYEHVRSVAYTSYIRTTDYRAYIVGMLHDVLEDTPYTEHQLAEEFGIAIAEAVTLLTYNQECPTYDEYIWTLAQSKNLLAIEVKIDDLLTNTDPRRYIGGTNPSKNAGKYLKALQSLTLARTFCATI